MGRITIELPLSSIAEEARYPLCYRLSNEFLSWLYERWRDVPFTWASNYYTGKVILHFHFSIDGPSARMKNLTMEIKMRWG